MFFSLVADLALRLGPDSERSGRKVCKKYETLWLHKRGKPWKNQQKERNPARATTRKSPGQICVSPAEKNSEQHSLCSTRAHTPDVNTLRIKSVANNARSMTKKNAGRVTEIDTQPLFVHQERDSCQVVCQGFFLSEPVAFRRVYGLESYSRTSGESNHHRQSVSDTRVPRYQLSHEDDSVSSPGQSRIRSILLL